MTAATPMRAVASLRSLADEERTDADWSRDRDYPIRASEHEQRAELMEGAADAIEALREAADMLDVAEFPEGHDTVKRARTVLARLA